MLPVNDICQVRLFDVHIVYQACTCIRVILSQGKLVQL